MGGIRQLIMITSLIFLDNAKNITMLYTHIEMYDRKIMILVDTSVLIDFFKNKSNEAVKKFNNILLRNIPYGINVFIYQELLLF